MDATHFFQFRTSTAISSTPFLPDEKGSLTVSIQQDRKNGDAKVAKDPDGLAQRLRHHQQYAVNEWVLSKVRCYT